MKRITVAFVAAASLGLGIATPASSAPTQTQPPSAPATAQPVPPEKLDTLLGPIALYPDALVLQILECSTNPDQIKKLDDWMKQNPDLKGTAAQDAALAGGFEASFVAIVLFPSVVQKMAGEPDWTKGLGQAFTGDRAGVFASIQRLRAKAQTMGNLKTSEQQKVETVTTTSGQQVIVIQPSNPEVVYVPQYTTVVYTQPPPPPGQTAAAGLIGFTTGVIIGAAIAENNDCWGYHGGLCNENYEDYAQHRENMAAQRGENQGQRQENRSQNQSNRQSSSSANQAQRQESRGSGQSASGQSASSQSAAARGSAQGASAGQRTGADSGAMSGYQSGAKEREASARGRSSETQKSRPAAQPARKSPGGSRGGGRGRCTRRRRHTTVPTPGHSQ